ncbi:MAG: PKD domain-containing protein, partial [Nitrospirales bacterium]
GGVFNSRQLFGTTRDGFWFSGMNNYIRDNVVANSPDFAYNYNGYYLTPNQPIPNFRGANMETDSTIHVALPVLESARNEAYGATGQGLWATWSRGCCSVGRYADVSLFKDYRIWHVNHSGAEFYHESRNTLDGFILRNDVSVTAQSQGGSLRFNRGFHFSNGSYENGHTIFRNIDMQGFNVGIRLPLKPEDGTEEPNVTILEDSYLKNYVNIQEGLPNINEKETVIRNVRTEPLNIPAISGQPAQSTSIHMRYSLSRHTVLVDRMSRTHVYDFNGIQGNNFDVYFEEQAPDYPIPPDPDFNGRLVGCPDRNSTNQECMDNHGVAVAGVIAPCVAIDGEATCSSARARATALGIHGLVFPIDGTVNQAPVAQISPNNVSGEAPFSLSLNGAASTDPDGTIVSYQWNFGDGNTDNGEQVTHTFDDPGTYVVELTVSDNQGATDRAITSVTVTGSTQNNLPVVGDDTANTQGGTSVVIDVIANDQDDDDGLDPSTVTIVNGPTQGAVTVHPDGKITYSHDGVDTFTYTIRDASGAVSNVGTVTIQIE